MFHLNTGMLFLKSSYFGRFFFLTKKKHIKLTLLSHINRISQVVFTTSHVIVSHFWWIVGWSYHIKSTENRQSHIKIWYSQPCFCFFFGRFPRQISQKIRQISRTSPANRISRLWPLYTIIIIILRSVVLYIYSVYIVYNYNYTSSWFFWWFHWIPGEIVCLHVLGLHGMQLDHHPRPGVAGQVRYRSGNGDVTVQGCEAWSWV